MKSSLHLGISAVGIFVCSAAAQGQTVTVWQNIGSDWGTAVDWSAGVPNSTSFQASLPSAATRVNPNLAADFTIDSLVIDNTLGSYNITQTGSPTLSIAPTPVGTTTRGITVTGGTTNIAPQVLLPTDAETVRLTVSGGATLNFNGNYKTAVDNNTTGSATVIDGNGNINFSTVNQVGGGTGTKTVTLASTYTGTTRITGAGNLSGTPNSGYFINGGTLLVNGVQTAVAGGFNQINVGLSGGTAAATLGGTGTLTANRVTDQSNDGVVVFPNASGNASNRINAGDPAVNGGIGMLTLNANLNFSNSSSSGTANPRAVFDIANTTSIDLISVIGGVNLNRNNAGSGRAILNVNFGANFGGTINTGDFIKLIDNDGTDAIANQFSTAGTSGTVLGQGAILGGVPAGYGFTVTYTGGDGNDFGLISTTSVAVPEPSTWTIGCLLIGFIGVRGRKRIGKLIRRPRVA